MRHSIIVEFRYSYKSLNYGINSKVLTATGLTAPLVALTEDFCSVNLVLIKA